jgi:hypothetical protein
VADSGLMRRSIWPSVVLKSWQSCDCAKTPKKKTVSDQEREQRRDEKAKIKVQKLIKMSDESEDEVTIRRERRLAEFLDNEDNDDGNWSPPAKVKKAHMKKKREELSHRADRVTEAFIDQLQERVVIWSKADPMHMDHMKVGKAWEEVQANLQEQFAQKVLEETGSGSIAQLKTKFKNLKDNFNK